MRLLAVLGLAWVLCSNTADGAPSIPDLGPLDANLKQIVGRSRSKVGIALIHLDTGANTHVAGHARFPMARS